MINMAKRTVACAALLMALAPGIVYAEMMDGEYFLNTDPGIGNGTAFQIDNGVSSPEIRVDATGLRPGLNLLGIRVANRGHWSTTMLSYVWMPQEELPAAITAAEYYWDTDPGIGEATPLAELVGKTLDANVFQVLTIPAANLTEGGHQLGIRVQTAAGWSNTHLGAVVVRNGVVELITGLEYFWGDDPGEGCGIQVEVAPAPEVVLDALTIDFPQEYRDEYTLGVRGRTAAGWGPTSYWTRTNVPVSSVALDTYEVTIEVGTTMQINAETAPENALFRELDWTGDAPEVFSVDENGELTALGVGNGTLTVSSRYNPSAAAACAVTVTDKESCLAVVAAAQNVEVHADDGFLSITGSGQLKGTVVNAAGQCVAAFDTCGRFRTSLPAGIYIVVVNGEPHKLSI